MKNRFYFYASASVLALAASITLPSCGGDDGNVEETVGEWIDTFAQGLAIASPTEASTSFALFQQDGALNPNTPIREKAEAIRGVAAGNSADACRVTLGALPNLGQTAQCYGPNVDFSNHPDGGTPTNLPSNDLGFWDATEGNGDEACAAAQMNKLLGTVGAYVDTALLMQAASVCLLTNSGVSIPSPSISEDFTEELSETIQPGPLSPTIELAEVTSETESAFTYVFRGTTDGASGFDVTIQHINGEGDTYSGIIYGYFEGMNREAFSVIYEKDGDEIKAHMTAAGFQLDWSGDIFDEGNYVKITASGDGVGNQSNAIMNVNTETGEGNVSYAWNAGGMDSNTRVFNVFTKVDGQTLGGCGFFGYGEQFSETMSENTNQIEGMICNWAGPGHNRSSMGNDVSSNNYAQKQCFSQDIATGIFENSGPPNIYYWPTNDCERGGMDFNAGDWQTDADGNDWPGGGDDASNLVQNLAEDSDFEDFSAPEFPDFTPALAQ